MQSRTITTAKLTSRIRGRRLRSEPRHDPLRPPSPSEARAHRVTTRPTPPPAARLESELDKAVYNCGCGFVFEAPVLTSIDCPHCGDAQAW